MTQAHPDGVMADAKNLLEFFERGVGMFFDLGAKLFRVELAPMPPAFPGCQIVGFGGVQIAIDRTARQAETPGGLGFGAALLNELDDPLPQIQRIGFHAS